jgi:two-component sensor histidine kinase
MLTVVVVSTVYAESPATAADEAWEYLQLSDNFTYNRSDSALWASLKALELAKQTDDLELLSKAHRSASIAFGDMGLYDEAIEQAYLSIALIEKNELNDAEKRIADCYHSLAWYYTYLEDTEKPLPLFHRALSVSQRAVPTDSAGMANSYHALGAYHYLYSLEMDSAIFYLSKAVDWYSRLDASAEEMLQVLVELVNAYYLKPDIAKGDSVLAELRLYKPSEASDYVQNYILYLEGLRATAMKDYPLAIDRLETVYNWGDTTMLLQSSVGINLTRKLIETLEEAGEFEKAYHYLSALRKVEQETIYKDRQRTAKALEYKHETARKELQIRNQQKQLTLQRVGIAAAVVVLLVISVLLVALYRTNKRVKQKNEKIAMLMRELHHRVKNNLQTVSSLLGFQSMRLKDADAKKAVTEGRERLRAMALIHNRLYTDDDVETINIREYLTELINELRLSYGMHQSSELKAAIEDAQLDAETALPLGLIVNELVTNTFKYAKAGNEGLVLTVSLAKVADASWQLTITDNGVEPASATSTNGGGFGLKLVDMLVQQLNGTWQQRFSTGYQTTIQFRLT